MYFTDALSVELAGFIPKSGVFWADIQDDDNEIIKGSLDPDSQLYWVNLKTPNVPLYVKIVDIATKKTTWAKTHFYPGIGVIAFNPFKGEKIIKIK
jgi:hypothetical protein